VIDLTRSPCSDLLGIAEALPPLSQTALVNGTPHGCAITEHDSTIRRAHSIGRKSRPLANAATDAPAEDLFVLGSTAMNQAYRWL
jgi:hypothetical protein